MQRRKAVQAVVCPARRLSAGTVLTANLALSSALACSSATDVQAPVHQQQREAGTEDTGCEFTLRSGHADVYVQYSAEHGPSLRVRAQLETGALESLFEPEKVCIEVPRETYDSALEFGGRPAHQQWDFLGIAPGEPFWFLPQVARVGVPWLGVAADSAPALKEDERWTLTLVEIHAPSAAQVSLWSSDSFGNPRPLLATAAAQAQTVVAPGSHAHFNWGFTVPGKHSVVFEISGVAEAVEHRARSTFRFEVLP